MAASRRLASLGSALLLCGCYIHTTNISVTRPDTAPSFTQQEQEAAREIAIEIGRRAGFSQSDAAAKLSEIERDIPSSWPYLPFVSLGDPGGDPERRSVSILGEMRRDRRELRISVRDIERGEPTPATQRLIGELRAALEREFSDSRVEVTFRKALHLLAP